MGVILTHVDSVDAAVVHRIAERARAAALGVVATLFAFIGDTHTGAIAIILALDALPIGGARAVSRAVAIVDAGVAGVIGRVTRREARRAVIIGQAGHARVIGRVTDLPVAAVAIHAAAAAGAGGDLTHAGVAVLVGGAGHAAIVGPVTAQLARAIVILDASDARALGAAHSCPAVAIVETRDTHAQLGMAAPRAALGVEQALHAHPAVGQAATVRALGVVATLDTGVLVADARVAMGVDAAGDAHPRQAAHPVGALIVVIAVNAGLVDADPRARTLVVAQAAAALAVEAAGLTGAVIIAQAVDADAGRGAAPVAVAVAQTLNALGPLGVALAIGTVARVNTPHADAIRGMAASVGAVRVAQTARAHAGFGIAALPRPAVTIASALHAGPPSRIAERTVSAIAAIKTFHAGGRIRRAARVGAVGVGDAFHARPALGIADAVRAGVLAVTGRADPPGVADQPLATAVVVGALDAAPLRHEALSTVTTVGIGNTLATQPRWLTGGRRGAVLIARAARHTGHASGVTDLAVGAGQLGAQGPLGAALTDRQATPLQAFKAVITGGLAARRAEVAPGHGHAEIVFIAAIEVAIAARAGGGPAGAAATILGAELVGSAGCCAAHHALTEAALLVSHAVIIGHAGARRGRRRILAPTGLRVADAARAIVGGDAAHPHITGARRTFIRGRAHLGRRASQHPHHTPNPPAHRVLASP